jgi:hypothetical protein
MTRRAAASIALVLIAAGTTLFAWWFAGSDDRAPFRRDAPDPTPADVARAAERPPAEPVETGEPAAPVAVATAEPSAAAPQREGVDLSKRRTKRFHEVVRNGAAEDASVVDAVDFLKELAALAEITRDRAATKGDETTEIVEFPSESIRGRVTASTGQAWLTLSDADPDAAQAASSETLTLHYRVAGDGSLENCSLEMLSTPRPNTVKTKQQGEFLRREYDGRRAGVRFSWSAEGAVTANPQTFEVRELPTGDWGVAIRATTSTRRATGATIDTAVFTKWRTVIEAAVAAPETRGK